MKKCHFKSNYGFVLIDAMIAMVVVAIGLFGVAKLNSVILEGTGISKTRAEAVHLAEEKIEECRTNQPPFTKCVSSTSGTKESRTGVNQVFTREWRVENLNVANQPAKLSVCVTWGGTCWSADVDQQEKKVELHTLLAWTDLGTGAALGNGANAPGGGMPKTPTGVAVEGGNNGEAYATLPSGTGVTVNNDGTRLYQKDQKVLELIDDRTKKVLLTISDGSAFSSIEGSVYISWDSKVNNKKGAALQPADIQSAVNVVISGGGACLQYFPGNVLGNFPTTSPNFSFYSYRCYMGKNWYGNIGIVRFDNGGRVCLGDPQVTIVTSPEPVSRQPIPIAVRNYRGYYYYTSGSYYDAVGIGLTEPNGTYTPTHYGAGTTDKHHFLLTTITGQPTPGECRDLEGLPTTTNNPFPENTGILSCMTGTCPSATGFATIYTNVQLVVNWGSINPNIASVSFEGGTCSAPVNSTNSSTYTCRIDWTGWAGDYWSGRMIFDTASTLTGLSVSNIVPTATISYESSIVAGTGNLKWVQINSVPKIVTGFQINLTSN